MEQQRTTKNGEGLYFRQKCAIEEILVCVNPSGAARLFESYCQDLAHPLSTAYRECNRLISPAKLTLYTQAHNIRGMLRGPKVTLAGAVVFVLLGATAAAIYMWEHSERGPTPDEYRVYRVLLTRLTANNNRPPSAFALSSTTLRLVDPHSESWVPTELRPDRMTPPEDGVSFCGDLCGREFVKRNLVQWHFDPSARGEVGFPIVEPSQEIPPQIPPKYRVVEVTRAGFNVWHTRAFVSYSADCNDYSPEYPVMCLELGDAYLEKKNGVWELDHYEAATF